MLQSTVKIISHPQLTGNLQDWINAHTHKRKTLKTLTSSTYFQYLFLYRWLQLVFLLLRLWLLSYEHNQWRAAPEDTVRQASKLHLGQTSPKGGTHVYRKSQITEVRAFGSLDEEGENDTCLQVHTCSLSAEIHQSAPTLKRIVRDK